MKYVSLAIVGIVIMMLTMPTLYAQGQIPQIPSIKEVSGRYVNDNAGIEITFPAGWSGMEMPLIMGMGNTIAMAVVMPGGIKDPSSVSPTGPMIMLNVTVIEKATLPSIKDTQFGKSDERVKEPECKLLSFSNKSVNGVNGIVVEVECEVEFDGKPVTMRAKLFNASQEKDNTIRSVMLLLASTVDKYSSYVGDFDKALDTLRISNARSMDISQSISKDFTQEVSVDGQNIPLNIYSNSDVKNLRFDAGSKTISFNVEGEGGSLGITDIYPNNILKGPYIVTIDGEPAITMQITKPDSGEEGIRILYTHSIHEIKVVGTEVIPEFPIAVLPILALITGIAVFMARGKGMYGS
ncbi:hypothetical protein HRbin05_00563 [archaeon HR05]|nr:hypothetical protein HRbin05_00563 [archaeon HR05]